MTKLEICLLISMVAVLGAGSRHRVQMPSSATSEAFTSTFLSSCATMPCVNPEAYLSADLRQGVGPVPEYIAHYVYPEVPMTLDGVALGEPLESVAKKFPETIVHEECVRPDCRVGWRQSHLLERGRGLKVSSEKDLGVTFALGTSLACPSGKLLQAGMDGKATVAAMGYPQGEKQISMVPVEGGPTEQGRAWRYVYPDKVVWVMFREMRIHYISMLRIEPNHHYLTELLR